MAKLILIFPVFFPFIVWSQVTVDVLGESVTQAPQPVSQVKELEVNHSELLVEELYEQTSLGVFGVETQGPQVVQVRGQSSHHTKVTWEGMDLSEMAGPVRSVNWSQMLAMPLSEARYHSSTVLTPGSSTLGGHIQLLSPKQVEETRTDLLLKGDSDQEQLVRVKSQWKAKSLKGFLQGSYFQSAANQINNSNGSEELDRSNAHSVMAGVHWILNSQSQLGVNVFTQQTREELDDFDMVGKLIEDPDYELDTVRQGLNVSLQVDSEDYSISDEFRASLYGIDRKSTDIKDPTDSSDNFRDDRFRGYRSEMQWARSWSLPSAQNHLFVHGEEEVAHFRSESDFTNYDFKAQQWATAVGAGSSYKLDSGDVIKGSARGDGVSGEWLGGAHLSYEHQLSSLWQMNLQWQSAHQRPSLSQLNDPNSGNPDLKFERSQRSEIEVLYHPKNIEMGMTYFLGDYSELIDFELSGDGNYRAINTGETEISGTTLGWKWNKKIVETGLQIQRLWIASASLAPSYRPEWTVKWNQSWSVAERTQWDYGMSYATDYWAIDGFERKFIKSPYIESFAKWSREFSNQWKLGVQFSNLLNQSSGFVPGYRRDDRKVAMSLEYKAW